MMGSLRLAIIILAAGQSKRMGSINKLLMRIEGRPMIQRVVDVAIEAGSSDICVVTGFERDRIESLMSGYGVSFVHNESFRAHFSFFPKKLSRVEFACGEYSV